MKAQVFLCLFTITFIAQAQLENLHTFTNPPYAMITMNEAIYTGLGGGGVYISNDSGLTWVPANQGIQMGGAYIFSFAARNDSLYAGGFGEVNFTKDGGQNWALLGLNKDMNAFVYALLIKDNYLFAGTKYTSSISMALFRKKLDNGDWVESGEGMPLECSIYALCVKGNVLFAGTDKGVFSSINNGDNWTLVGDGSSLNVKSLIVDNTNLIAGTTNGIYILENGSNRWTEAFGVPENLTVVSFTVKNNVILAGTYDGVYLSTNEGLNWTRIIFENESARSYYSMCTLGDYAYFGTGGGLFSYEMMRFDLKTLSIYDEGLNGSEGQKIYPNPFSKGATLSFGKSLTNAQLNIYNLQGQKIRSVSGISGEQIYLFRGELNSGFYLIQVIENNRIILSEKIQIITN